MDREKPSMEAPEEPKAPEEEIDIDSLVRQTEEELEKVDLTKLGVAIEEAVEEARDLKRYLGMIEHIGAMAEEAKEKRGTEILGDPRRALLDEFMYLVERAKAGEDVKGKINEWKGDVYHFYKYYNKMLGTWEER